MSTLPNIVKIDNIFGENHFARKCQRNKYRIKRCPKCQIFNLLCITRHRRETGAFLIKDVCKLILKALEKSYHDDVTSFNILNMERVRNGFVAQDPDWC